MCGANDNPSVNNDGDTLIFRKYTLESYNRDTFAYNEALDRIIYRPLAIGYSNYVPALIRTGIKNFLSNLNDINVTVNDLLQLKLLQASSDLARFLINSTLGVLGLFDIATHVGLEKHNEDFGQTLGYWGLGEGAYLVLPFLPVGMSIRDWAGFGVDNVYLDRDIVLSNLSDKHDKYDKYSTNITIANIIDVRANLLARENDIVGDRYGFIKDAYLQYRRFLTNDGKVSAEDAFLDDDFDYEDLEDLEESE